MSLHNSLLSTMKAEFSENKSPKSPKSPISMPLKKTRSQINISINQSNNSSLIKLNENNSSIPKKEEKPKNLLKQKREHEKQLNTLKKNFSTKCLKKSSKILKSCRLIEKFSEVKDDPVSNYLKNNEHRISPNYNIMNPEATVKQIEMQDFGPGDAVKTMNGTHQRKTMYMTALNLREEPNDFNKTYSTKFKQIKKDQDRLLEENIYLNRFSLNQDMLDNINVKTDRTRPTIDNVNSKQKSNPIISRSSSPFKSITTSRDEQDFKSGSNVMSEAEKFHNVIHSPKEPIRSQQFKRFTTIDKDRMSSTQSNQDESMTSEAQHELQFSETYVPSLMEKVKLNKDMSAFGQGQKNPWVNQEIIYETYSRPSTSVKTATAMRFSMNQTGSGFTTDRVNTRSSSKSGYQMNMSSYNRNLEMKKNELQQQLANNLQSKKIKTAQQISDQINQIKKMQNSNQEDSDNQNNSQQILNNLVTRDNSNFSTEKGTLIQKSKSVGYVKLKNLDKDKELINLTTREEEKNIMNRTSLQFEQMHTQTTNIQKTSKEQFLSTAIKNFRVGSRLDSETKFENEEQDNIKRILEKSLNNEKNDRVSSSHSKMTVVTKFGKSREDFQNDNENSNMNSPDRNSPIKSRI